MDLVQTLFLEVWVALKRAVGFVCRKTSLLGGGVLGDSLGSFTDGVLGELAGQE